MSAVAAPSPRGRMVDVGGGRMMHLLCAGPVGAGPTVLFEAGAFGFSADFAALQDLLTEKGVRSCAYDRAGLGFSDPGPKPRDSLAIAGDLEALLAAAGETGPLILCAHSMAGLHVRLFTARNPSRVVGLVLVDATTPEAMDWPQMRQLVGQFGFISRATTLFADLGLFKPLAHTGLGDMIGLAGPAHAEKQWAFANPKHNQASTDEVLAWAEDAKEAAAAAPYDPALPVAVVVAGDEAERLGFRAVQAAPARASRHGFVEHVAGSSHATLLGPVYGQAIVRAIEDVRAAATAPKG